MARIECPRIALCEMFPLFKSPGFLEVWKHTYCVGKFPQCKRYQLFLKGEKPAPDLLPDGKSLTTP